MYKTIIYNISQEATEARRRLNKHRSLRHSPQLFARRWNSRFVAHMTKIIPNRNGSRTWRLLTLVMRSLARLSKRCSSFCVSTVTGDNSSQIILCLSSRASILGSSRTSFQNSFTVFLLFFASNNGGLFGASLAGGGGLDIFRLMPKGSGGPWGSGGGNLAFNGGGGGARTSPAEGTIGGGGGGTPFVTLVDPSTSISSSEFRSVKSRSQRESGLFSFFTSSSQCSSFSDFFVSCSLGRLSPVGDFNTSAFDFDFARPSFAFEISPLMSPILKIRVKNARS